MLPGGGIRCMDRAESLFRRCGLRPNPGRTTAFRSTRWRRPHRLRARLRRGLPSSCDASLFARRVAGVRERRLSRRVGSDRRPAAESRVGCGGSGGPCRDRSPRRDSYRRVPQLPRVHGDSRLYRCRRRGCGRRRGRRGSGLRHSRLPLVPLPRGLVWSGRVRHRSMRPNGRRRRGTRRGRSRCPGSRHRCLRRRGSGLGGVRLNGLWRSGLRHSGLRRSGLRLNGLWRSGLRLNGLRRSGLRPNTISRRHRRAICPLHVRASLTCVDPHGGQDGMPSKRQGKRRVPRLHPLGVRPPHGRFITDLQLDLLARGRLRP